MNRIFAVLIALAPALGLAESSEWKLDPMHTHASFTIRHLVISNVRGEFKKLSGEVYLDDKDPAKSTVEATLETGSIDTGVEKRDADLRSERFFEAAKYPTITFKSTKVEHAGKGKLKVTGDLTMHGVTKPVVLQVDGPTAAIQAFGNVRRGFSASTKVNRRHWGLNFSDMIEAGPVVGDDVTIEIAGEMVKEAGEKAAAK